jgi:hypothetical protein
MRAASYWIAQSFRVLVTTNWPITFHHFLLAGHIRQAILKPAFAGITGNKLKPAFFEN